MTNGNYEQIATKIVVFAEPSLNQITPTSGPNAGKETSVLNFKAFHPNYTRNDKGDFRRILIGSQLRCMEKKPRTSHDT